jgi:hypothetical protein
MAQSGLCSDYLTGHVGVECTEVPELSWFAEGEREAGVVRQCIAIPGSILRRGGMGRQIVVVPRNRVTDRHLEHLRLKGKTIDVDVMFMGGVLCHATAHSGQTQESGTNQGATFSARQHGSGAAIQVGDHGFSMTFMNLERHQGV